MRLTIVFGILGAVLLVGCNREHAPSLVTHKVEGKIVHSDGKPYSDRGSITFRHETADGVSTQGTIEGDGSFTLYTNSPKHNAKGALEGPHSVTVMPDSPDQSAAPIRLKKAYVISPGDNSLTIDVDN